MKVSLLLATRNRASSLAATLQALQGQRLSGLAWELVVVNNDTLADTKATLEGFRSKLPLTVIDEARPGKSRALNRGLVAARGELVVFTDDDVRPRDSWLEEYWNASLRHPRFAVFGGPISPVFPESCPPWLRTHRFAGALFTRFAPTLREESLPAHVVPLGPNLAVRREALAAARFDPDLGPGASTGYPIGADVDFALRLTAAGHGTMFVPNAIVRHVVRPEQLRPDWLLRRSYQWGRGVAHHYPDCESRRLAGAPAYVWAWLALSFLRARRAAAGDRLHRLMLHEFVRGLLAEERRLVANAGRAAPHVDAATCRSLRGFYAGFGDAPSGLA